MYNRLADIVNAYAITLGTPEPGIHWFVDPTAASPRIYMKEIAADHSSGNWPKYYGGTQATATVKQGFDLIDYSFHQTMEHYANNIILACTLRKPADDYWCEDADTNAIWTVSGDGATSDDAANKVVGADSLKLTNDANRLVKYYFDFANNLDFTNIGSQDSIPTIDFYGRRTATGIGFGVGVYLHLYTTRDTDYFSISLYNDTDSDYGWMPEVSKWYGVKIPIGPFYKNFGGMPSKNWKETGTPLWTDIDGIQIYFSNLGGAAENYFWLDDLHLSGKIIREARDESEIGTYKERQAFLRLDTAVDDSCTIADNTGTAARLAASELFKRGQCKTAAANRFLTGTLVMPMKEDLLPGQQLYVNAGLKPDGTSYRYQMDMRCKNVTHEVSTNGYITRAKVTSDLWNSLTFDTPSAWGILKASAGALGNAEARDLKASGVDINIPRLTWDPTA